MKTKDIEEQMKFDYGSIYISIKEGVLKIDFDGGDGVCYLSDDQLKRLKEILNSVEIK